MLSHDCHVLFVVFCFCAILEEERHVVWVGVFTELPLDAAWTAFHASLEFSPVVVPILLAKCRMYVPLASLTAMFQRFVANLISATISGFWGSGLLRSNFLRWQSFSNSGWREFLLNSYQSTVGLSSVVAVDRAASFTVEKKVV